MDAVALLTSSRLPTHLTDPSPCFPRDAISTRPPPPPPPPPPLPPSLPPPPPPPPTRGDEPFSRGAHRRSKMRNFNWDTIPQHNVLGKRNVWTSQRKLEDFQLDTERIEELFSHSERQRLPLKHGTVRKSVWGLQSAIPESEIVSILNSKKSMNIGILLKQFKRPMQDIVDDIRQGNMRFAAGRLRELSRLLPDDMEFKKLSSFKGDVSQLPEADRFFLMLVKIPGYEERLKSLLLREEFIPYVEETKKSISIMTAAANELLACDDLHSIIRLVLKAGNYMNAGGYAGRALGFRMASLLKLVDTKANKPGMNLMHYVAMQAQQIDIDLLNFPEQLQHIGKASRIQKQEVETDFKRELGKIKEAEAYSSKQPDLQQQMEEFLHMATGQLVDIEASLMELESISRSVAEYFCEDPATFMLEECCSIFHSFCEKFEKAVQENREREAVERRRRQQRERETLTRAAKRRSVGTCSRKDLGDDGLESVLTNFLSTRLPRRRQPSSSRVNPAETLNESTQLTQISLSAFDTSVKMDKTDTSMCQADEIQDQDQSCTMTLTVPSNTELNDVSDTEEAPKEQQFALGSPKNTEPSQISNSEALQHDTSAQIVPEIPEKIEVESKSEQREENNPNQKKVVFTAVVQNTPTGPKKAPCIEDITTPRSCKTSRRRSVLIKPDRSACGDYSAERNKQETSRKEPCQLRGASSERLKAPDHVWTSARRGIGEVDLGFQGDFGSPWTVLSPHTSPYTPRRRHSFSSTRDEEPDDGVWALPDTPVHPKAPALHACRTYQHSASTSGFTDAGMTDSLLQEGVLLRSASVSETSTSVPGFRFGGLFPRRARHEAKRHEPSALMSFFQRFGDRGRLASVGDSRRAEYQS
ncbi:FH2 domain containing 3 [Trichomycterus rosablanca]|uniref:FH2 domain containing 3 n=1 Tax=Trichomycterus rosablanca TaxID=2290929 RepID=UPI002F34EF5F